jgi:hypothetical protein
MNFEFIRVIPGRATWRGPGMTAYFSSSLLSQG